MHAICFALSLALHLGVSAPYLAWKELSFELDSAGDDGTQGGPVGNDGAELVAPGVPVNVSIYTEPVRPKAAPKEAAPTEASSASTSSGSTSSASSASSGGTASSGSASGADGVSDTVAESRTLREGSQGKPPRGKKKPCEAIDEVQQINDTTWRVERDILDWYATHLRELEKQAGVSSHRGEDGKRDGAKLYLPRCSLLKQGGLRNGDIIHRVNGRKVNTIPQGVATWLAVRGQSRLTVELTRKNGDQLTHVYRLKK